MAHPLHNAFGIVEDNTYQTGSQAKGGNEMTSQDDQYPMSQLPAKKRNLQDMCRQADQLFWYCSFSIDIVCYAFFFPQQEARR